MEQEYKYQIRKDGVYRLHVEEDNEPWNPRTDQEGNIGTMFCQHNRYQLGDQTEYKDAAGMKSAILKELDIPIKRVEDKLRKKKAGVRLSYNRSSRCWQLYGFDAWVAGRTQYGVVDEAECLSFLRDSIMEYLPMEDLIALCRNHLVILPLFLYDHSGLTMNTSGFPCRWDSGQVGYIWATAGKAMEIMGHPRGSKKEIREQIIQTLLDEVSMYDMYLKNDCYGGIVEQLQDGEWSEVDSCWGYYCSGTPLEEIAKEVFGNDILDEFPMSA